jgi:hypothetical protein
MALAATRADSAFTTRWYNDPIPGGAGTVPVWAIAPESVIVTPAPGRVLWRGEEVEIWGWAWADGGIARVEMSVDGGAHWQTAEVETRAERAWQRFRLSWRPDVAGPAVLCTRAHGHNGATQPDADRRNALHRVEVEVA